MLYYAPANERARGWKSLARPTNRASVKRTECTNDGREGMSGPLTTIKVSTLMKTASTHDVTFGGETTMTIKPPV